jgi:hypothetical protein
MPDGERWLRRGALLTGAASLLHLAIILGGPDWYRFFGAGERMAQLSARGSARPAFVTAAIASVLGLWALYGLSGAGVIRRLPLLRPALALIAGAYFARGLLGVPAVLFAGGQYAEELKGRMTLMVVSSLICLFLGSCYAFGAARIWQRSRRTHA